MHFIALVLLKISQNELFYFRLRVYSNFHAYIVERIKLLGAHHEWKPILPLLLFIAGCKRTCTSCSRFHAHTQHACPRNGFLNISFVANRKFFDKIVQSIAFVVDHAQKSIPLIINCLFYCMPWIFRTFLFRTHKFRFHITDSWRTHCWRMNKLFIDFFVVFERTHFIFNSL